MLHFLLSPVNKLQCPITLYKSPVYLPTCIHFVAPTFIKFHLFSFQLSSMGIITYYLYTLSCYINVVKYRWDGSVVIIIIIAYLRICPLDINEILNERVRATTGCIKKDQSTAKHNCYMYIHDKVHKATPRPAWGSPTVGLENVSGIEDCVWDLSFGRTSWLPCVVAVCGIDSVDGCRHGKAWIENECTCNSNRHLFQFSVSILQMKHGTLTWLESHREEKSPPQEHLRQTDPLMMTMHLQKKKRMHQDHRQHRPTGYSCSYPPLC